MGLEIDLGSWPVPSLFSVLRGAGNVPEDDMLRTFNNGIGMVVIVPETSAAVFSGHPQGSWGIFLGHRQGCPGRRTGDLSREVAVMKRSGS